MAKSKTAPKEKIEPADANASAATSPLAPSAAPAAAPASGANAQPVNYQVLARRYRSRDFDELVGQEATARTLQNAIRTGRTAHAYLFTGTRGVGKTSMARIFARALNATEQLTEQAAVAGAIMRGEDIDVIEIDAASNRGIDNARDLIAGAGLMPARGRYKIYIIDEVHMLTTPAFNALLKTMEEPPSHVKFILCTTEPQSVPATIQSRCQRFDFRPIPTTRIAGHLRDVLARENAEADERVVLQIARMANGSMRDSLSLLERLLAAAEQDASGRMKLSWQLLEDIFGLPDESLVERIIDAIGRGDAGESLRAGGELLERGMSIERSLELLAERYRWMMLSLACGKDTELLEVASETRETIARLAGPFDTASLVHLIALCDAVGSKARDSSSPRAIFDAALVRMALNETFLNATAVLRNGSGGAPPAGKVAPRAADSSVRPAAPTPTGSQNAALPASGSSGANAPRVVAAPATTAGSAVAPPAVAKSIEPKPGVAAPLPSKPGPSKTAPNTTPPCATNAEGFWSELVAKASSSPRDGALISSLICKSWDGQTLQLSVRQGESSSGYLSSNPDMVRSVLQRLAGRSIEVKLEVEAAPVVRTPVVQRGVIPNEVREHPIVKLASDLFDAVVVDWAPIRRDEVVAAAGETPDAPLNDIPSDIPFDAADPGDDLPHGRGEYDDV